MGSADAPLTCVLFSAFGCSTCRAMSDTPSKLVQKFGKQVRVIFKHKVIPPSHPDALDASIASLAAKAQGKFWQYHDKLFAAGPALDRASLLRYATELGLNLKRFEADLNSSELRAQALGDALAANEVGAHSMPNLLCNGVRMSGAKSHNNAVALVEQELPKARAAIQGGIPAQALYASVTKSGKAFEQLGAQKFDFNTANSPALGKAGAKVEVVVFEDFQ
jgi:protein-disulfide isomerase